MRPLSSSPRAPELNLSARPSAAGQSPHSATSPATPQPRSWPAAPAGVFTGYQRFVIALLALLQFTIVLDFMTIAPLGAFVMHVLQPVAGCQVSARDSPIQPKFLAE